MNHYVDGDNISATGVMLQEDEMSDLDLETAVAHNLSRLRFESTNQDPRKELLTKFESCAK